MGNPEVHMNTNVNDSCELRTEERCREFYLRGQEWSANHLERSEKQATRFKIGKAPTVSSHAHYTYVHDMEKCGRTCNKPRAGHEKDLTGKTIQKGLGSWKCPVHGTGVKVRRVEYTATAIAR